MNKNNAASIRARLKNIADKERKPFDFPEFDTYPQRNASKSDKYVTKTRKSQKPSTTYFSRGVVKYRNTA